MRSWIVFCVFSQSILYAQTDAQDTGEFDQEAEIYLNHMDSFVLSTYYKDLMNWDKPLPDDSTTMEIPENREELYFSGLRQLDASTPFDLKYNDYVRAFIDLYIYRKPDLTQRCLGISEYYFPIIEEVLDKYDLPIEFKYLAVVESALNIKAKSKAGAAGLWQFMYRTGKVYGLEANSYVDQRYELYASTEAACRFFIDLYRIYGNWELVIAAYNCGPGNVNKAIRRSGGKADYWDIRPWLPKETRGYVPAFIAVNYAMNFYTQHGLTPVYPDSLNLFTDTLRVKHPFNFEAFSNYFCTDYNHLMYLNPSYKISDLPQDNKAYTIRLPMNLTNAYLERRCDFEEYCLPAEQDFSAELEFTPAPAPKPAPASTGNGPKRIHVVKSGEVLGVIAEKYGVNVSQIRDWNNLSGSRIYASQELIIYSSRPLASQPAAAPQKQIIVAENPGYKYHTIKPGDTLWDIANQYEGISVTDLKNLNKGVDFKRLKPGSKIIVSTNS